MSYDSSALSSGDIIDNKYYIRRTLGEGTFGIVYLVTDKSGKEYALKLLKLDEIPESMRNPLRNRFEMEFQTGQIQSPYLVHTLTHGMYGNCPYLIMEYCSGGDLASILEHGGKINPPIVAQHVLRGLQALHVNGKVHRDLKPANVLLKGDGVFALTDFGISGDRNNRMTQMDPEGKARSMFGTYAYMPPEQYQRKRDATVLPTTDIFSFGVMMFKLLTERYPFGDLTNSSDGDIQLTKYINNARNGRWRKELLQQSNASEWTKVIGNCLHPDFSKRLQNTTAVLSMIPSDSGSGISTMTVEPPPYQEKIKHGVQLHIMQGEEYGRIYRLDDMLGDRAMLTMGRADNYVNNSINIIERQSSYVSRCHCTLELDYDHGTWVIRDGQWRVVNGRYAWVRSTNGTFVNSTEVTAVGMPFAPGDIISIGEVKLRAEGY